MCGSGVSGNDFRNLGTRIAQPKFWETGIKNNHQDRSQEQGKKSGNLLKTGFKLMVTLQSECVPKILKLCRMNKIFF